MILLKFGAVTYRSVNWHHCLINVSLMVAIVTPVTSLGFLIEPYDPVYLCQELYRDMTITTKYKHEVSKLLTILDLWPYSGAYL